MSKIELRRLDSVTNNDTTATALINDNFKALQDAIDNTISRDGTTPNFMDAELDMNSRRIINVGSAVDDNDVVILKDVKDAIGSAKADADRAEAAAIKAGSSAQSAQVSAANAIISAQSAAASAQEATDIVTGFDAHAEEAKNNFDVNALTLTARFDNNYKEKTEAFNKNAQDATNGINTLVMQKIDDIDAHATEAENKFNLNATNTTDTFNNNAAAKLNEYNSNATIKQNMVDASAKAAKTSEENAASSATRSEASALAAKDSADVASKSEAAVLKSVEDARVWAEGSDSEVAALGGTQSAKGFSETAGASATKAATSEDNAAMSASDADISAQAAALSEQSAKSSADVATNAVADIDADIARAETAATNAEKFANASIEEYPEGSSKYWRDQAQSIVGSGQMLLDVDQDVNSSKTFLKDQAIKSPDLDIRNDRSKRGNGLIFTDKNGTQTAGIGVYINNNQSPECRLIASNGTKSAFAGLGVTTGGQGFFEIPEPSDTSDNNDAVSSRWVNKKVNAKQDKLSTAQITATNSGITSAKVATYDGYNTTINGKQAQLNAAQLNAVNSGIDNVKVTKYDGYEKTINGKQQALNSTQLNAVNSGITLDKVSTYDGYKALIDGKQPAGNYQTVGNLSQILDASVSKYPSNKAVATAIANIDALPTQTGQAGKFLSTDGTSAKWDTVDLSSKANTSLDNLSQAGKDVIKANSGGGVAIGTIFSAPFTDTWTPKGAVPCNGKEYLRDSYPQFFDDFLKSGRVVTITYEQFANEIATKGFCDVYAINTSTRTFKVPQIPDGLTLGVEALAKVRGNGKALGLTEGERSGYLMSGTGSVYLNTDGNNTIPHYRGSYVIGRDGYNIGVSQDADKSGIIAEPKAKNAQNLKWFCQLASGEINKADLDLNGLRADIANSANIDLSNVKWDISFTDGYCYLPNGLLLQWGTVNTVNAGTVQIVFKRPFADTKYIPFGLPEHEERDVWGYGNTVPFKTKFTTSMSLYSNSSLGVYPFSWAVLGKGVK